MGFNLFLTFSPNHRKESKNFSTICSATDSISKIKPIIEKKRNYRRDENAMHNKGCLLESFFGCCY